MVIKQNFLDSPSPSTNVHGCTFVDEVSAPHMCKSPLFTNYFFWILLSLCLWRTAAFCLLLLYRNKMQHRAFRLYLFVFPVQSQQCFSSRRRLLLLFLKDKKDTASIAVRRYLYVLYMYASSPYRRNWL